MMLGHGNELNCEDIGALSDKEYEKLFLDKWSCAKSKDQ
jgi:hypothetical protein